jgi:hypothetical protein
VVLNDWVGDDQCVRARVRARACRRAWHPTSTWAPWARPAPLPPPSQARGTRSDPASAARCSMPCWTTRLIGARAALNPLTAGSRSTAGARAGSGRAGSRTSSGGTRSSRRRSGSCTRCRSRRCACTANCALPRRVQRGCEVSRTCNDMGGPFRGVIASFANELMVRATGRVPAQPAFEHGKLHDCVWRVCLCRDRGACAHSRL